MESSRPKVHLANPDEVPPSALLAGLFRSRARVLGSLGLSVTSLARGPSTVKADLAAYRPTRRSCVRLLHYRERDPRGQTRLKTDHKSSRRPGQLTPTRTHKSNQVHGAARSDRLTYSERPDRALRRPARHVFVAGTTRRAARKAL